VNEGINHYQGLRETLSRMTGHRGYNTYFESWTPSLMEEESEENNLNELFVQETLDPRIESVMPILNKLQKKVAEMKEVGALSEWADNIIDEGAAVDAYMAGKSPALAHFADKLDKEIDEGDDDIDDPVVSAITRRIIRQHPELLKHGPDKVLAAIADVADFVGDVEEIGSSDVSGWVKQVERHLNGVDEGMFDKVKDAVKTVGGKVLDKLGHGSDEELIKKLQKDAGIPASAQHGKPSMAKQHDDEDIIEGQQLSIQQLATISDEALDNAYKYGRSSPGNTFGWQANLKSAQYAKQMIDKGVTDIEAISDAIHKGWNVTAQAFVQNPEQFDDTAKLQTAGKLEAKLQQRAELMKKNYSQLPEDEKEKDRVVARALLQALKGQQGQQGVAEGVAEAMYDPRDDDSHDYGTDLLVTIRRLYVSARDGKDPSEQFVSLNRMKDGIAQSEEPRLQQSYNFLMKNLSGGAVTDPKMIMQIADKAHQMFHPSLEPIAQATREAVDRSQKQGVVEGSRNAYLKHNNLVDIEKPLAGLKSEFEKFLQTHDPEEKQKYQQGIKQRIKTEPMSGPKGVLPEQGVAEESKGLWANIHAKRERIKHGSGEHMRKPGSKGAPTADALRKSAK
jgi:hypothetical protein